MAGLFSKVLGYKKTWQSCVVIAGDDILTLSQAFIAQKNMSDTSFSTFNEEFEL